MSGRDLSDYPALALNRYTYDPRRAPARQTSACSRVASVLMAIAPPEPSQARLLFERAKSILLALKASSRLTPTQEMWIPLIEAELRQLDEVAE